MSAPLTPSEARAKMTEVLREGGLSKSAAKREAEGSVRRVFDSKDKKGS